jgi:DNA topoisomerase-1
LELKPSQYKRLLFYEITPKSINNSLQNPIGIDDNLVQAQLSRQVLDRMIGFCLSKVIQKKLNASSAGRVQSIVLKLIVEREKEIKEQEKKKKFTIDAVCKLEGHNLVAREVDEEGNTKVYETRSRAADSLEKIDKELKVVSFFEEKKIIPPKPPLITSSMIFEAKSRLGFNVEQTTRNAQKLYEGINLDNKKRIGLITYPRTDSTRMNEDFIRSAYKYIEEKWNKENYNFSPL